MAMLLDKYMPEFDVTEVHSIRIKASTEIAYQAFKELTLAEISGIVRLLFWLRALPEKPAAKKLLQINYSKPLLKSMLQNGFVPLQEEPPDEFVFGLLAPGDIGRFWKKSASYNVMIKDADSFMAFTNPDYVRVIANFSITPAEKSGYVIVRTESRSKGLSKQAFDQFSLYWAFIRPWSGLIRRLWLRGIKTHAEQKSAGAK
jgi:hypothetical protein